jgi:dolichyl-phosphate-mannose--protein O-mannosyl transferase
LTSDNYFSEHQSIIDTDLDDETYASSSDFPAGYATHYATFPSVNDQKYSRHHESMLFFAMIGCFGAALLLFLIAGILVVTGKHKLRVEVDAGVFVGVISSLFFAAIGVSTILYRKDNLGWLHRACVGFTFVTIMFLNFLLLSLVINNTGK